MKYISIYDEFVNSETGSPTNPDCGEYHVNMDLVMADGLHPVAAGYKIWAQKLKKVMASTDKADTTLTTLSYRLSDTVKKNAVTGFETGKKIQQHMMLYYLVTQQKTEHLSYMKLLQILAQR